MRYEATPMEKAKNYAAELALGPVQDLKLELCESAIYTCLGDFEREIRPDMLLFHVLLELTNPKNSGEEFEKFKMCLLADHDNVPSSLMAGIMDVLFATRYDSATDPIVYKTFERIFDYRKINGDSIGLYEFSQVNRLVNDTEYGRIIENYIQSCFETGFENGTMAYTLVAATVHMNKNNYGYQWLSFIPSYDESFVRIQNGTEMSQTLLLDVAGLYMMAAYLSKYKVFRLHAERFLVMSKKIIKRLE